MVLWQNRYLAGMNMLREGSSHCLSKSLAKSYIERFIGTLRRELLDHVIVLGQTHLDRLLRKYIEEYYHVSRPHQGLHCDTPVPEERPTLPAGPTKLKSIPLVGGLHHRYVRVAA